jgi:hypothetical protein
VGALTSVTANKVEASGACWCYLGIGLARAACTAGRTFRSSGLEPQTRGPPSDSAVIQWDAVVVLETHSNGGNEMQSQTTHSTRRFCLHYAQTVAAMFIGMFALSQPTGYSVRWARARRAGTASLPPS